MRKMLKNLFFISSLVLLYLNPASAASVQFDLKRAQLNTFIENEVMDSFKFSGLAQFYNRVDAYVIDDLGATLIEEASLTLNDGQKIAFIGRHNILVIEGEDDLVIYGSEGINWKLNKTSADQDYSTSVQATLLLKSEIKTAYPSLKVLKYIHLWQPLRLLCLTIEDIIIWLNSAHSLGWGISVILLSVLFKIFILPANIYLTKAQRKVSHVQAQLTPQLEHIKSNFDGEEAHNKLMLAHKELGVTPFYTLKPTMLALLPFPFLIAIFNVLGELDTLQGHSFLWINDISYPDAICQFGMSMPLLGSSLNLLPILMTILTLLGAILHQNKIITPRELKKQRLNLYLMAFGFFVLFYPFPAVMVLYWTCANFWQMIQQRFIRI